MIILINQNVACARGAPEDVLGPKRAVGFPPAGPSLLEAAAPARSAFYLFYNLYYYYFYYYYYYYVITINITISGPLCPRFCCIC